MWGPFLDLRDLDDCINSIYYTATLHLMFTCNFNPPKTTFNVYL